MLTMAVAGNTEVIPIFQTSWSLLIPRWCLCISQMAKSNLDTLSKMMIWIRWENAPFGHIHDWRFKLIKVQHPGVVARRVDVTTLIIYFTWLVWWCRIPSEFADTPRDSSWVIIENIYLLHVCVCVCVVHCVMGDVFIGSSLVLFNNPFINTVNDVVDPWPSQSDRKQGLTFIGPSLALTLHSCCSHNTSHGFHLSSSNPVCRLRFISWKP